MTFSPIVTTCIPTVGPRYRSRISIMTYGYALWHCLRLPTFVSNKFLHASPGPSPPPVFSIRTYQILHGTWIHMAKGPFCNNRPAFGSCFFVFFFLDTHSRLLGVVP